MSSAETGQGGPWHGTTILTVRKGGLVAIGGDGQVSIGQTIIKANAKKVRRLGGGGRFYAVRAARIQARAVSRSIDPRRCRTRQGLAHRSLSAAARSDDDRCRQRRVAG